MSSPPSCVVPAGLIYDVPREVMRIIMLNLKDFAFLAILCTAKMFRIDPEDDVMQKKRYKAISHKKYAGKLFDMYKSDAIFHFAERGDIECVYLALRRGQRAEKALYGAASGGRMEILQAITDRGGFQTSSHLAEAALYAIGRYQVPMYKAIQKMMDDRGLPLDKYRASTVAARTGRVDLLKLFPHTDYKTYHACYEIASSHRFQGLLDYLKGVHITAGKTYMLE